MASGRSTKPRDTHRVSRTTVRRDLQKLAAHAELSLLIYYSEGVQVVAMKAGAPMVVGRERPSDVVIADRSLSRQHARFLLEGGGLRVEDLGSTNGTRVRGELVQSAELRPGDAVALGAVMISPHLRSSLDPAPRGLSSHDAFVAALGVELERARYFGDGTAVLFLEALDERGEQAHVCRWWDQLRTVLRPVDRAALYSPRALEVLLPRVAEAAALEQAGRLVSKVGRRLALGCGVAAFSGGSATADELLEASRQAATRASLPEPVVPAPAAGVTPAKQSTGSPVVASAAMRAVFELVERAAQASLPVLLCGETGTGKEVVARAIHQRGPRAGAPMLCVNCGAIAPGLVESTLFGHVKGAFTGAHSSLPGVFAAADGGSVLLDEIGELPAAAQAALLRVLEGGRILPVGASVERTVDVRVLAATHCDLQIMCAKGEFRSDLLYRLDALQIVIPPLHERKEDITPLARFFVEQLAAQPGCRVNAIKPDALSALERYHWPGNVRELRNAVDRAAVIAQGDHITVEDLPARVREAVGELDQGRPGQGASGSDEEGALADDARMLAGDGDLKTRVRRYEARVIAAALRASRGNKTQAARRLGVPVRTLAEKIRRLGVDAVPGGKR